MQQSEMPHIIQLIITAGSGVLGVGIAVGFLRAFITKILEDIVELKRKQGVLRGEDSGEPPIYVRRTEFDVQRQICKLDIENQNTKVCDTLNNHTKAIRSLQNFALWFMQKQGMELKDANKILEGDERK
jgi:hypothetical protein